MNTGALVTRMTIWVALLCYAAAIALALRRKPLSAKPARIVWTAGCILFLAHMAAAFQFYHQWSHTAAAEDTRRQTLERIGFDFSGGIYFNYAFAAIWCADCARLWIRKSRPQAGNRAWSLVVHGFLLFMIFNSTVVFGHSWARIAGAAICLFGLSALLVLYRRIPTA